MKLIVLFRRYEATCLSLHISFEIFAQELLGLFKVLEGGDLGKVFTQSVDSFIDHGLKLLFRTGGKHC